MLLLCAGMMGLHSLEKTSAGAEQRDFWNWQPRAASIEIEPLGDEPGSPGKGTIFRVHGQIDGGWNYIASDRHPVAPGKLYRLSAWLRVDRRGPATPAPFLKCEFVGDQQNRELGQVHTQAYRSADSGKWQELTEEFQVPRGAHSCWLAVEKGTSRPTEIDLRIRDVRLKPITQLTALRDTGSNRFRLRLTRCAEFIPGST